MDKKTIQKFLESNNFVKKKSHMSLNFDDSCEIYSKGFIQFKITSDRTQISLEIRRKIIFEEWFDFSIVYYYFNSEGDLLKVISIEDQLKFLYNNVLEIEKIFNSKNYRFTKSNLQKLENKRMKLMFPNLK